ncbi:MAG: hypothetical protein AB3N23_08605 [Paracoccaceae bacterium]
MDADLALVLGIIVAGFSIPSIISALGDGRSPRASMVTILIAGGLILYAISTKPGGYTLEQVPEAFVNVIAPFVR